MNTGNNLFDASTDLIINRYPTGWGGAAALLTEDGSILTSIAPEIAMEALGLCIEVGAMCEAHKINQKVTHSLCVMREDEHSEFKILSPCGICQERLLFWGEDVLVAHTNDNNEILFIKLKELQPYHWSSVYKSKVC